MPCGPILKPIFAVSIALLSVGCIDAPPEILRPYEINREHEYYPDGPPIVAGRSITVCYDKSGTTAADVRSLAAEECAKAGLGVAFVRQRIATCPLITPVAAVFSCVGAGVANARPAVASPSAAVPVVPDLGAPRGGYAPPPSAFGAADVSTTAKSAPFPTFLLSPPAPSN